MNLIQRMLILDGESARGKTQLANVIQAVVGRENVTQLRTKWLAERFETYRFLKKTLLIGVDVEPDFLSTKGASVLKGLVGGDWFDAEQKLGTGSFPMQGNFCVIVTSNARLRVRLSGDVGAWRRRLLIVRYEAPPPKKIIPDFGALLAREEGPGILNWCIAGLDMVLRDIDASSNGDIALTDRQTQIVDSLLAESDSLRFFLLDRVERAEGADLSVNEIVEAYAAFCPEKGWRAMPITEVQRFPRRADAGAFSSHEIALYQTRRQIRARLFWSHLQKMSLDISKLENVRKRGEKITARCPACAEVGHDQKGEHLVINADGRFGCVVYPGDSADAKEHRKRIFALCGDREIKPLAVHPAGLGRLGRVPESHSAVRPLKTGLLGRLGRLFQTHSGTGANPRGEK